MREKEIRTLQLPTTSQHHYPTQILRHNHKNVRIRAQTMPAYVLPTRTCCKPQLNGGGGCPVWSQTMSSGNEKIRAHDTVPMCRRVWSSDCRDGQQTSYQCRCRLASSASHVHHCSINNTMQLTQLRHTIYSSHTTYQCQSLQQTLH